MLIWYKPLLNLPKKLEKKSKRLKRLKIEQFSEVWALSLPSLISKQKKHWARKYKQKKKHWVRKYKQKKTLSMQI